MRPKRDKRTFRELAEAHWKEYWDKYPYFEHCSSTFSFHVRPRKLDERKLKKSQFYPKEFSLMSGCPSAWNTLYHIRPCRRQSRKMTEESYVRYSIITNMIEHENLAYIAEEKFYPEYKLHVYYY